MLKNPNYLYGPQDLYVPANLNFGDFMLGKFWSYKDNVALIDGTANETWKYGEIAQEATNLVVSLIKLGVKKGDTVAILSENRREYFSAFLGAAYTGAILTTINPLYTKDEINHICGISEPKYVFCSPLAYKNQEKNLRATKYVSKFIIFGNEKFPDTISFNDLVTVNGISNSYLTRNVAFEELQLAEVQGQTDTLMILYSSGTTGLPKGVVLTHLNILGMVSCKPMEFTHGTILGTGPWFHAMGLVGTMSVLNLGISYAYLPKFTVESLLKTIERYRVEMLIVVPAVVVAILKMTTPHDFSSVKRIVMGAAPAHEDTIKDLAARYPGVMAIVQGYGMTESSLGITRYPLQPDSRIITSSVGQVLNNTIVKIVDPETRKSLGPNQNGEICIKGTMVTRGYVGKDRKEDFDDEGFLKTGDVGYYDDEKFIYVVDRLKELIKYKGHQVAPAEIEALLIQHDAVKEAGVVGLPDKECGELPLAFISVQSGKTVTEKEIQDYVAQKLSNPKHLRGGVRFIDEMPRNQTGKLLRKVLRTMAVTRKSKL